MDVDIWMPFYIGSYLKNTSRLSTLQHGAYCLLIFDYWIQGPPPDDDEVLASITKLPVSEWVRKHRSMIQPFFEIREGQWHHERVDLELAAARAKREASAAKASLGGQAKQAKIRSVDASSSASSSASSTPEAVLGDCSKDRLEHAPSPSPSPISPSLRSGEKRARRKPETTPLPPDFAISDRVQTWAKAKGHFALLDQHFENFLSTCKAKGYEYADWDEALMGAIRKDWAELRTTRRGANVVPIAKPWRAGAEPDDVLIRVAREVQVDPWDRDGGETHGQFRSRIVDAGGESLLKPRAA